MAPAQEDALGRRLTMPLVRPSLLLICCDYKCVLSFMSLHIMFELTPRL
jgi:hypothetical protein